MCSSDLVQLAGATYSRTVQVTLPTSAAPGAQFVLIVSDVLGQQLESDETNNVRAEPLHVLAPDLVLTGATAPDSATSGQTVPVRFGVQNQGDGTALAVWRDRVFISTDAVLDPNTDPLLTTVAASDVSPLAAGGEYLRTANVVIPSSLNGGPAFLLFVADAAGEQAERDETNNIRVWPIEILSPDLTTTEAAAPATAVAGQSFPVQFTVLNQGTSRALVSYTDRVYLSTDQALDPSVEIGRASCRERV